MIERAGRAGATGITVPPACYPRAPCCRAVTGGPELSWPDTRLVRECRRGSQEAWAALLEKYGNLIFSIPVKQGLAREDCADVFQRVCLLLMAELPRLREAKALPMWLIRVTAHECARWRRQQRPSAERDARPIEDVGVRDERPLPEDVLAQVMREQALRDAVHALPERCRRLIDMLFYQTPTRPYADIATALGLARGSIGFIRGRCLTRLRRELEKRGFR